VVGEVEASRISTKMSVNEIDQRSRGGGIRKETASDKKSTDVEVDIVK
jgi:hypothetical protein